MPKFRVLQGAQLPLQQHGLALLQGLFEILLHVAHIGPDHLPPLHELGKEIVRVDGGLVVEMDKQSVFQDADVFQVGLEAFLVEELVDLDADLGVFIGIEGGDAATWWSRRHCPARRSSS